MAPAAESSQTEKTDLIKSAHDAKKAMSQTPKRISLAEYEALMLALKGCKISGINISNSCPAKRALVAARRNARLDVSVKTLATQYIQHSSVPIRIHAAAMMKTFSVAKDNAELVLKAASTETHPAVLAKLVRALLPLQASHPKIGALMIKLSTHPSPLVRTEAVDALLTNFAKGVDGSFAAALKAIESDPSQNVRERGCRKLGRRVDDEALPLLTQFTDPKFAAKQPKLYTACWEGLARMAASHPFFDATSAKAFDLIIKRLAPPCSVDTPPWKVMSVLGHLSDKRLLALAPWLKDKLPSARKALEKVVLCREANWIARNGAADSLSRIGASKAELTALKTQLTKLKKDPNNERIAKKLGTLIK